MTAKKASKSRKNTKQEAAAASATVNLGELSLEDLVQLEQDARKAIMKAQRGVKTGLEKQFKALAKEKGLKLVKVVWEDSRKSKTSSSSDNKSKRTRKPSNVLYRNPKNPEQTWPGRGRSPKWYQDLSEKAKAACKEEVKITKPESE
ncbi:MAG: H-NS histone family protein [Magnetococcales bacterium]|nr:H-NS histone family protein [Magnetococcales bacterium]